MPKEQVKFYVTEEEKKRLELLAKLRFMTVPEYVKKTALGVQVRQIKERLVEVEVEKEVIVEVPVIQKMELLNDEELEELREFENRIQDSGFISIDMAVNQRVKKVIRDLLERIEN